MGGTANNSKKLELETSRAACVVFKADTDLHMREVEEKLKK